MLLAQGFALAAEASTAGAVAEGSKGLQALFDRLVADMQPSLIRLCRGYEAVEAEQEELLQEIFLRIWRALPGFRGDSSLRTWVYRVAHNVAASHVLKAKRRRARAESLAATDLSCRLEEQVARRTRLEQLQRAIQKLALLDRQVLLLHLEELPHGEISEITGISVSNVSTRIHRAKQQVRGAVEGQSHG